MNRDELEPDTWYKVRARNFELAIWDGKVFWGRRTKWGETYWAHELHWDDDPHYGTVKPIEKVNLEDIPNEIVESYAAYRRTSGDAGSGIQGRNSFSD
jgi:hypothetical protein